MIGAKYLFWLFFYMVSQFLYFYTLLFLFQAIISHIIKYKDLIK